MNTEYEVIVIGGGPAGYSLGIRLAQAGQRVAVIEREGVGGVCLNWGCVPSKALITTAQRLRWAREGADFGVEAREVRLDLTRAQARSRGIVHHHTSGVASLLKTNGADLIVGAAQLTSRRTVRVQQKDGSSLALSASRAIVLATGAKVRALPNVNVDGERIITAREAVFLEKLPEHLVVLGGGVIGIELGSAYLALGSQLTIVEMGDRLLPGTDRDLTRIVERELGKQGARILYRTSAVRAERTIEGARLTLEGPDGAAALDATHVLVAAGFVPNTDGLGLSALGVHLDARGHIATDEHLETNVPGIFALGDVSGPPYLAHKAYKEAEVLAEVLRGKKVARDWRAMPAVIFSHPEIATVGVSEEQAAARGTEVTVAKVPFSAFARAQALGETAGFVKLVATPSGRLLGAGIVGPEASELVMELSLALEMGASLEDLALTVHPHPTLSEAVHEAAELALGHAVHVVNRPRKTAAEATLATRPGIE